MALFPSFSRRKRQAAGTPDVFTYNICTAKLREQTIQIIRDANKQLGRGYSQADIYDDLVMFLRKELGLPRLNAASNKVAEFDHWYSGHPNVDELMDAIEYSAFVIRYYGNRKPENSIFQDFSEELNARFLEDSFGYQLEGIQIVQIDSTFAHSEITVPALILLSDARFKAAEDEFRQAHDEFKNGQYEDSIHDCCNALESVLKTILTIKGWVFKPTDTMSKLIDVALQNNLIPSYMQAEFTGLRQILESGTPTVRNKAGGHGAGAQPRSIPRHIAAFQLHQTAAAIILLVESM